MRSCPLYGSGSTGIYLGDVQPKVGVLVDCAWSTNEECRFRVLNGGSTIINKKSSKTSDKHLGRKRKAPLESPKEEEQYEVWRIKDVVMVDDPGSRAPVGEVVMIDGPFAMVYFSRDGGDEKSKFHANPQKLLENSRLLRKDELQVRRRKTKL